MRGCKKAASRFWDGSVIGVVSNNHVVNPSVYKNIPFDSLADITPITIIGATPFVLVAHPSVPAKNVQELIAYAKSKPGVLNYGSSGNGTILHLGAAMFVDQAKLAIQHIPYKGMGPLMNDVLSGQVQLAVVAVAPAAAHIKSGALRAMGVTTSTRVASLPGVPTIAEQGLPAYELDGWIAPWPLPACPRPSWPGCTTPSRQRWRCPKRAMRSSPRATKSSSPRPMPLPPSSAAKPRAWRRW